MPLDPSIYNQVETPVLDLATIDAKRAAVNNANLQNDANQLKMAQDRLAVTAKLLSSVKDQNSYSRALKFATSIGMAKPGQFAPEYDPETIEMLKGTIAQDIDTLRQQQLQFNMQGGTQGAFYRQLATDPNLQKGVNTFKLATQGMQGNPEGGVAPIQGYNQNIYNTELAKSTAGATGKATAEAGAELAKKGRQANDMLGLVKEAENILPQSSSGLAQSGISGAAKMLGVSTDATKADARLKVIGAGLTSNVPRMEGPQGVLDLQLYKQAVGDIANSSIPYQDRLAALDTIKMLQRKYANVEQSRIPTGQSIGVGLKPAKQEIIDASEYFK